MKKPPVKTGRDADEEIDFRVPRHGLSNEAEPLPVREKGSIKDLLLAMPSGGEDADFDRTWSLEEKLKLAASGEELGEQLLQAVREMKAGSRGRVYAPESQDAVEARPSNKKS